MDDRQKEIFHNSMKALYVLQEKEGYKYRSHLWTGGFGSVFTMVDSRSNKVVAVKCTIPKTTSIVELSSWKDFDHPNVVPLLKKYSFDCSYVFIMPLLRTTLGEISDDMSFYKDPLSYDLCRFWFKDAMRGLSYLHDLKIAHNDLKSNNIFIKDDGHACVADFSIAGSIFTKVFSDTQFVTYLQPPECTEYFYKRFRIKRGRDFFRLLADDVDMWQFGILVLDMLTNKKLSVGRYSSDSDWEHDILPKVFKAVEDCDYLDHCLSTSFPNRVIEELDLSDCQDFLRRTLVFLPRERMNSRDACKHYFLAAKFPERDRPKRGTPFLLLKDKSRSTVARSCDDIGDARDVDDEKRRRDENPDELHKRGVRYVHQRRDVIDVELEAIPVILGEFEQAVLEPKGNVIQSDQIQDNEEEDLDIYIEDEEEEQEEEEEEPDKRTLEGRRKIRQILAEPQFLPIVEEEEP